LRLALAQAWLFLVAAELIASSMGLGFLLTDSQNNGRTDRLILAIILLALLGKITDTVLGFAEKRAIARWSENRLRFIMSYPAAKIGSMIISSTAIATQRSTAIKQLAPALSVTTPVLGVVDFDVLDQLIEQLGEAYPEPWLHHMVGVDTVRLPGVLEHFRARGFGAQTRSAAELQIANQTGFQLHELLHSAGVNSLVLLNQLVHAGMNLSIDNFVELSRVDELIEDPKELTAKFGLRV